MLSRIEEFLLAKENKKFASTLNNFCPLCQRSKKLIEDKNFVTGKVQGKVCADCLAGLCSFKNDINLLNHAITICQNTPSYSKPYCPGLNGLQWFDNVKILKRVIEYVNKTK
jgi:hypothetical protein